MNKLSRREALRLLGMGIGAAAIGCGTSPGGPTDDDAGGNDQGPPDAGAPDARPLTPAELLAGIDTFVVLCMENRSFDHFLGSRKMLEGRAVDGLTGSEFNPTPGGGFISPYLLEDFTPADPPHDWDACHQQWNNGANDGFVMAHAGPDEAQVMGYHNRAQIPITHALADAGVTCDRWYASVMGPTWPNRFYLHCATSGGQKSNVPVFGLKSVFDLLGDKGISSRNYYHDVAWCAGGYQKLSGLATIEQFFDHAAAGQLPQFSIIDPQFFGAGANDDHPDHDIRLGQALIASVVSALGQSPQWERSLLVITYDEHGGFYDHVPPPTTADERADFRQLGFRVPSLVIGPTVRRGAVVSDALEHVSMLATLATRFELPPLNQRMSAARDLSACIDPAHIDDPQPPPVLPALKVSMRALRSRPAPTGEHSEIAAAADRLPRHLDRRGEGLEIAARVLREGARLGAIVLED